MDTRAGITKKERKEGRTRKKADKTREQELEERRGRIRKG